MPQQAERFVARGELNLALGDIAVARQVLLRAAEAEIARAALLLASTYDPMIAGSGIVGVQPNTALARTWYKRAGARR